ncbi:MAG: hypothetical protein A3K19_20665 [Lentisphaerae bacterium RIFOXYB12_FULL_65_16]|nr:MAG: hypothetical protein A3K18_22255 [Lentisphaerae bacterium RIFOXYA12_64_32]OGV89411.1 MAG: hypothetical protein A3K19_20665 [Lentisphaerae bacterium RIFOXYB12_FULL_65_16]
MSVHLKEEHIRLAEKLAEKAQRAGGLAPLDLDTFWADEDKARKNAFAPDCPQVPLGIRMGNECVFAELDVPEDWHRLYHDAAWRLDLARRYNDKAEKIVGRRLLSEQTAAPTDRQWPHVKELWELFEARNQWHEESMSYWLFPAAETEEDLASLLDRVETRLANLREFMLPPNWTQEKERLKALGVKPPLYRGQRGPITFAMSIFGVEKLIFLIMDNPALAARYRDVILRALLERARILDEEAGYTPETAPHGWGWADDNCAMLNAEMYEFFGWPILKAVFERYSPKPGDSRYQHSDSDMGHLLPVLGTLNLNGVNFSPNVMPADIRRHLPQAVIHGQLAPFTFSRNEEVNMVAEFLRDVDMVRDSKGLVYTTAGSINNGSRLSGMRLLMAAIQEYGRY